MQEQQTGQSQSLKGALLKLKTPSWCCLPNVNYYLIKFNFLFQTIYLYFTIVFANIN